MSQACCSGSSRISPRFARRNDRIVEHAVSWRPLGPHLIIFAWGEAWNKGQGAGATALSSVPRGITPGKQGHRPAPRLIIRAWGDYALGWLRRRHRCIIIRAWGRGITGHPLFLPVIIHGQGGAESTFRERMDRFAFIGQWGPGMDRAISGRSCRVTTHQSSTAGQGSRESQPVVPLYAGPRGSEVPFRVHVRPYLAHVAAHFPCVRGGFPDISDGVGAFFPVQSPFYHFERSAPFSRMEYSITPARI